ncbi:hypothetical protein GCM10010520_27970 [Rhizobium viscosum]
MDLAAEINQDRFASALANPDTDRECPIRPQGKFSGSGAIARAVAAMRRHQASVTQAAQDIGDARTGKPGMPAKFRPGQWTMPADRFQDDADISVGDFSRPQTDCFTPRNGRFLCLTPRPGSKIPHDRLP